MKHGFTSCWDDVEINTGTHNEHKRSGSCTRLSEASSVSSCSAWDSDFRKWADIPTPWSPAHLTTTVVPFQSARYRVLCKVRLSSFRISKSSRLIFQSDTRACTARRRCWPLADLAGPSFTAVGGMNCRSGTIWESGVQSSVDTASSNDQWSGESHGPDMPPVCFSVHNEYDRGLKRYALNALRGAREPTAAGGTFATHRKTEWQCPLTCWHPVDPPPVVGPSRQPQPRTLNPPWWPDPLPSKS